MSKKYNPSLLAAAMAVSLLLNPSFSAQAAQLAISPLPLFITTTKANVLLILDNSNSMDEDATGQAVGSSNPASKSEIARTVAKNIVATYSGQLNLGLMAYRQSNIVLNYLFNSQYDASYDDAPALYDPNFTGPRDSATKKFRVQNPSDPSRYIYYNVALPFYSASPMAAGFCYSPTAKFDNSTNVPPQPWDNYYCFNSKTGTSNVIPSPPTDATAQASAGYTSGFGTYTFFPTDSDKAQGILDFGPRLTWTPLLPPYDQTWFSPNSPGRGFLHVPIRNLDATQAAALNAKLATAQFAQAVDTPLRNAGQTPMEGTLLTANDYFGGSWSTTTEGYAASGSNASYPLPNSCGKNYVALITDGLPSTDASGADITNPTTAVSQAAAAAATLKASLNNIETYVIGFALPYGVASTTLDQIAISGGTSKAYNANNFSTLNTALYSIFSNILQKSGASSAAAVNSGSWSTTTRLYQAKFNSADWSGQLLSYSLNSSGTLITPANWDAAQKINTQEPINQSIAGARHILTYNPTAAGVGIPFQWTNLSAVQQASLNTTPSGGTDTNGQLRLNYLRGDATNESCSPTPCTPLFRMRPTTKLGDIVNSAPVYVGPPNFNYPDSLESVTYSSFKAANQNRTAMVYVGGNDGMLHGFDASNGSEKLGYVPNMVVPNLTQLTSPTYSHRYYVDGSPTVGDAFYAGAWHTVLVGGLAAGGKGYYALDVTDPATLLESNASTKVLWEFTPTDNPATIAVDGDANLGLSFSQPNIVKTTAGWVAIFGNGYNAGGTGTATLYIVNIATGDLIKKIDTGVGSAATPNGLATAAAVDIQGDNVVDYVYAGDLQGNLWKFDLTANNPGTWAVAYKSGNTPLPLFTAVDASNNPQPITTRPEVGKNPNGGYTVLFGTGKYLELSDKNSTANQSFYGIWDNGAPVSGRSNLQSQTVTAVQTVNNNDVRVTSANPVNWCTGTSNVGCSRGWYIDLPDSGERSVTNSLIRSGRIIFTTLVPAANVCVPGGTGWLFELNALTGAALSYAALDINGDGALDASDKVILSGGGSSYTSAVKTSAIPSSPNAIVQGTSGSGTQTTAGTTGKETKEITQSDGSILPVLEKGAGSGRISWRVIRE